MDFVDSKIFAMYHHIRDSCFPDELSSVKSGASCNTSSTANGSSTKAINNFGCETLCRINDGWKLILIPSLHI